MGGLCLASVFLEKSTDAKYKFTYLQNLANISFPAVET